MRHLSSLVYPISAERVGKPNAASYPKSLFYGYYESFDETKEHIELLTGSPVSGIMQGRYLSACLFLADSEIWWADTYRHIIEYAISHDRLLSARLGTIEQAFLTTIPNADSKPGFSEYIPVVLTERISHSCYSPDFRN